MQTWITRKIEGKASARIRAQQILISLLIKVAVYMGLCALFNCIPVDLKISSIFHAIFPNLGGLA
jgi:hypothetical protein